MVTSTRQGWGLVFRIRHRECSRRFSSWLTASPMTQAGGTVTLPFVIQNGQVFINDAFFRDASIQFGKITDSLKSDNFVTGSMGLDGICLKAVTLS
jgi:hypothetical protein